MVMQKSSRVIDGPDGLKRELITDEHIPYQLVLMNGIEDVRKGIAFNDDGGLGALLSLYSVLPSKIRSQFDGLPEEIFYKLRVKVFSKPVYHMRKFTSSPSKIPWTEWSPEQGKFVTTEPGDPKTVQLRVHAGTKTVEYLATSRTERREFAMTKLMAIIDVLEAEGILWKSRLELVGGEL